MALKKKPAWLAHKEPESKTRMIAAGIEPATFSAFIYMNVNEM
jgi:hypothetical protein